MRTLTSLLGNSQRLDGGSMFGNAPRALWSRWLDYDDHNRIPLACRCLLVRDDDRVLLFETGIGAFFPPKLRQRYGVVEDRHVLLDSRAALGLSAGDIDVVVLSHLHFDHAGGALSAWSPDGPDGQPTAHHLVFENAIHLVSETAWQRARTPHYRDRASFVPELNALLESSGQLRVVDGSSADILGPGYRFHLSHGHTPGLLMTEIDTAEGPVLFVSDMIPGRPWVHLPITMGYDRNPELLIDEKQELLTDLVARGGRLFYTHDPDIALSGLGRDERGRFRAVDGIARLSGAMDA